MFDTRLIYERDRCCPDCFTDPIMRAHLVLEGTSGHCDFCNNGHASTVYVSALTQIFQPITELFEPATAGMDDDWIGRLPDLIRRRWQTFACADTNVQDALLHAILHRNSTRSEIPVHFSEKFYDAVRHGSRAAVNIWTDFREYLKWQSRFLIGASARTVTVPLQGVFAGETLDVSTKTLESLRIYRARRNMGTGQKCAALTLAEMGAPPREKAIAGRANAVGIRVLYAALDEITAVAEARPLLNESVAVGELEAVRPVKLLNLNAQVLHSVPSPFNVEDLRAELSRADVLNAIGREMAKPVRADEQPYDYAPTQYVAELLRSRAFDGFMYESSVNPRGVNVVLFDPEGVTLRGVKEMFLMTMGYTVHQSAQNRG